MEREVKFVLEGRLVICYIVSFESPKSAFFTMKKRIRIKLTHVGAWK
jgi:hypothetical protein